MGVTLDSARRAISASKFSDETELVQVLLAQAPYDNKAAARIEARAADIVTRARSDSSHQSLLDTFLTEYGLSNKEGIALMCLAESLLRIPDQDTAERLIEDKLRLADWAAHVGHSGSLLVNASTWAMLLGSRMLAFDDEFTSDAGKWIGRLTSRLTEPVLEKAMRMAMRILGSEFVLGTSIENAIKNGEQGSVYSFDMLGEAARDAQTARRYFDSYRHAIETIGAEAEARRSGLASISIKLSALHPRYEFAQSERVLEELVDTTRRLCLIAQEFELELTIDAEESDRLELSLEIFERLARDSALQRFRGLGIVVQAYGKRAIPVLDWLVSLAIETGRRFPVRLVKGAYWDAEIKHAQVHGYPGFPVFTRKPSTDLSYLVCARHMLRYPQELFARFATHNAHTIASVMELAGDFRSFEFQRLHGMGAALYAAAQIEFDDLPILRTYAPVGTHDDLLAYLVRRLLENGANSSFVNQFLDARVLPNELVTDPIHVVRETSPVSHPDIRLPSELFSPERRNSKGVDLTSSELVAALSDAICASRSKRYSATPIVAGVALAGIGRPVLNPALNGDVVGECVDFAADQTDRVFGLAAALQPEWDAQGGSKRAQCLEAFADELEKTRENFVALLCREAGKTLPDAVDEIREAVDFCRYYAAQARLRFSAPAVLPGPTGESNELSLHGRGVFVCISPWNFPLAIFIGQIAAALAAGNTVVAKPAEDTPIIACEAVKLLHASGIPANACQLVTGDGRIGDLLVRHPLAAGVAFTGGTDTARKINQAMAASERAIVPLIAETGGQNAMIVDSTALLEQVTDDVIRSAFLSAGQRCSALRVLMLQEDIADKTIGLIKGAMDELRVGDPSQLQTDVGPIITHAAAQALHDHIGLSKQRGALLHAAKLTQECEQGSFVPPTLLQISHIAELDREHFGPILHVMRFAAHEFSDAVQQISATGFGLTFGIHTRIEARAAGAASAVGAGNVYVNRNMTGAVVGSQPFGGQRNSGTGPKAGGPNYLMRFATERVVTINTVATGGNTDLLTLNSTLASKR